MQETTLHYNIYIGTSTGQWIISPKYIRHPKYCFWFMTKEKRLTFQPSNFLECQLENLWGTWMIDVDLILLARTYPNHKSSLMSKHSSPLDLLDDGFESQLICSLYLKRCHQDKELQKMVRKKENEEHLIFITHFQLFTCNSNPWFPILLASFCSTAF